MRILFVTWDGPQVDYLQSLFIPIFAGLRSHGVKIDVLQFGWSDDAQIDAVAALCQDQGIGYRHARVWRRLGPLGAFSTALAGGREVRRALTAFGSDAAMPRSLMPALAVLAARLGQKLPILFDADGLPADERIEFGGLSPHGPVYRMLRAIETAMVRRSDAVIVRTAAAATILAERSGVTADRFHTVANGRDDILFAPRDSASRNRVRAKLGVAVSAPLMIYVGSVGRQYRFDRIAASATAIRDLRPDAKLVMLCGSPDDARAELAQSNAQLAADALFMRIPFAEISAYIAAADIGFAFRAETLSMRAVAPIKLSEYLLCGVPVIGTGAIGDTAAAIEAGVFMPDQADASAAAGWFVGSVLAKRDAVRAQARRVGIERFSLSRSIADYNSAIRAGTRHRPSANGEKPHD